MLHETPPIHLAPRAAVGFRGGVDRVGAEMTNPFKRINDWFWRKVITFIRGY